jgi:hypothetical protein
VGLSEDEEFETFVVRVPNFFRSHVVPIGRARPLTSSDGGHPWERPLPEQFRTSIAYPTMVAGCPSGQPWSSRTCLSDGNYYIDDPETSVLDSFCLKPRHRTPWENCRIMDWTFPPH